jgi:hypothetical protein
LDAHLVAVEFLTVCDYIYLSFSAESPTQTSGDEAEATGTEESRCLAG